MHDQSSFKKPNEDKPMTELALRMAQADEMKALVRGAADGVPIGTSIKGQMTAAWKALGKPAFWRVKAAWHGEAGSWQGYAVRDFLDREERRKAKEAAARAKAAKLGEFFAGQAARLAAGDADFHRVNIDQLLDLARRLGAQNSPVAGDGQP